MCLASPHNMPARNRLTPPASTLAHRLTVMHPMHPKMGIGMRWPQGWKLPPKVLGSHSPSMIARLIVNFGPLEGTPRHAPHTRPTVCSQGQTQVTGDSMTTGLGPGPRVGQTWISIWISRITSSLSARPQRGNSTSFLDLYFANLWSDCQKEGPWKMVQPLSDTPTPQRSSHLGSQLVDQLQTI